ncbi:MAG: hypothetical protein JWM93_1917 [Frankiales bacterium]|nr:hypothetical protein [Frankiales bacterium]
MWMRRRPPTRAGRGTGYEPVYADSTALRAIAAGLSASTAAALAAVVPDLLPGYGFPLPAPAAPAPTTGLVRLCFADASTVDLDAADPWARALQALAAELLAGLPS